MRIVDDPHRPDSSHSPLGTAPVETSVWRSRFKTWKQKLFSEKGITCLWGVVTLLGTTLILSLDHLALVQVVENDISTLDIYAPYDLRVEDVVETQTKRDVARQAVSPIYMDKAPIEQKINRHMDQLFRKLEALGRDAGKPALERSEAFLELVNNRPGGDALREIVFAAPSHGHWQRLRLYTELTLKHILAKGLSKTDYDENINELIEENLPKSLLSEEDREAVSYLVSVLLEPNQLIDVKAWDTAKEAAALKVKPDYKLYRKGQLIVNRGEPISPLKLKALENMGKTDKGTNWPATLGVLSLCLMFVSTLWGYNYFFESRQFFKPKYASLMATLTIGTLVTVLWVQKTDWALIFVPFTAYPLLLSIFTHPRVGVLAGTLVVFLMGLAWKIPFAVLSVLLFGSVVGVFVLSQRLNFNDRTQVMASGVTIGVTNALVLLTVTLLGAIPQNDLTVSLLGTALISGVGSGIVTFGLLPYLESVFRLITPFTLMEMGNHDKPLLKRMQFEAPGTFHHSLMVATLSEAAAEAIGANSLLARVGSLYHDIGKMKRPLFFIENQAYFGVENPHDKLTPRLSKMVVTAHPRDSVEMARQYQLPEVLIKFMTEHHGTLVAGYFYNQACQQEGEENVNKAQFRYPGPKPNIKETAICMMADACESAVRALKNPTPSQIEERIDKIIKQRIDDGQFENCPITFKDIQMIRDTFVRVIRGIQHNRIEYQQNMMQELGRKLPLPTAPKDTAAAPGEVPDVNQFGQQFAPPTPSSSTNPQDYHSTEY